MLDHNKGLKDLSFKSRIRHNYGCNENFYQYILRYKETWENNLFHIEEKKVREQMEKNELRGKKIYKVSNQEIKLKDVEFQEDSRNLLLNFNNQLNIVMKEDNEEKEIFLKIAEPQIIEREKRNIQFLNAGGHITSMKWKQLPLENMSDKYNYLATSIMINNKGEEDSVCSPALSFFDGRIEESILSGIQIWKYDLEQDKIELFKFFLTSDMGVIQSLDWVPVNVYDDKNFLGILTCCFTNGEVHIFKIEMDNPSFSVVLKSSLKLTFLSLLYENSFFFDNLNICCFDFLNHEKIIVGMSNGCIAEFVLPIGLYSNDDDEEIEKPSFVYKIGESSINSICVMESNSLNPLIYVNTTGVNLVIFDYNNPVQNRVNFSSTKTHLKPSYNYALKIYTSASVYDALTFNYIKCPEDAPNTIYKINAFITSSVLSEFLGHPLNITGTSDGDVILINYSRKILNGAKNTNKVLKPLRIWKLNIIHNKLTIEKKLEIFPIESVTQNPIGPLKIIISSVSWNENINGCSIYSVGSVSGLFILERLDLENKSQ